MTPEEFGSSEAGKKGGKARAAKLSKEERSENGKKMAAARWGGDLPVVTHGSPDHPLNIAGIAIPCYVLDDGTRVLSQAGFQEAMGKHRKANVRKEGEEQLPAIIQGKAIFSFLDKDLIEKSRPIKFRTPHGVIASGYRAEILPEVCELFLKARDSGDLPKNLAHVAKRAEILMRGLATVGIIALVDEATGFVRDNAQRELAKILAAFVAKELQKWLPTFDLEFYELMCDLRHEPLSRVKARPPYFGNLTNDLVYERLAPGVLAKLREKNPVVESGRRKHKHHQHLTRDIGHPKLKEHLAGVTTAMKMAKFQGLSWDDFMKLLDKTHPKQVPLPLFDKMDGIESDNAG